ncbi:hypothetical protein CASFOL_024781 [Castilleja foliolosa]|uniref:Serine-rich protein n=1 Tax=Castilleja foliolosa TaxID=1961234 RepID=A0ABD3CQB6_9LAMI
MEASSRNRSSQSTTVHSQFHHRSTSPSGRFCSSSMSSSFVARPASRSHHVLARSTSPNRVTLGRSDSPSSSVRFSASRNQTIASRHHHHQQKQSHHNRSLNSGAKKACMCSPTTHPGSFRCSLHKNSAVPGHGNQAAYRSSHQLNMRRSAMTNSLVRIGTVEGDLMKRALSALIRPSSHSLRRRFDFQPRPSRLSLMSKADDLLPINS